MKKRILFAAVLVFAALGAICACAPRRAAHIWSEEWSHEEVDGKPLHWHACLDENCSRRGSYAYCTFELVSTETPSTCTVQGKGTEQCTECGLTREVDLPLGEHNWQLTETRIAPTCFTQGFGNYACADCSATKENEVIPATGEHALSEDYKSNAQGHFHYCVNTSGEGSMQVSCPYMGEVEAHTEGAAVIEQPQNKHDGAERYYCTVCHYLMRTVTIPAADVPDNFEISLRVKDTSAPVELTLSEDGYYNAAISMDEVRYTVEFSNATVGGEPVPGFSEGSWSWTGKSGIKAYLYDDHGRETYTPITVMTSTTVHYYDEERSLWATRRPAQYGEYIVAFRYITMETVIDKDGKETEVEKVRAERKLRLTPASAASATVMAEKVYALCADDRRKA